MAASDGARLRAVPEGTAEVTRKLFEATQQVMQRPEVKAALLACGDYSQQKSARRHQFGTFLSGPVIKNHTFWSFNYEERRQKQESVSTAWWPAPAAGRACATRRTTSSAQPHESVIPAPPCP